MKIISIISFLLVSSYTFSQNISYTNDTYLKNDILYSKVNNQPFTGTIYSSEDNISNDCTCLLEAAYNNGKINGIKKEYHFNGKIKYLAEFKEGVLIGKEKHYNNLGILTKNIETTNITTENISSETVESWIEKAEKYYRLDDYNHAFDFYLKAAKQNNAVSQNMVGVMYEKGQSLKKSFILAKEWYEKSADQNNSDAQMNLAYLYFSAPSGIPQDKLLAEELLIKSSNLNNHKAQYLLGIMYANADGKGFIKDIDKAILWMKKSAESNYPKANEELAAIYFQKEDYVNALKFYKISANKGNSQSQFILGAMYRKGIGIKKSRKNAIKWFKLACKNKYENACEEVEKMNAFGNALLNSVN